MVTISYFIFQRVLESGQTFKLARFEQKVAPLVQGFAAGWRTSVDLLSREITTSFTNFKVGSTIVQVCHFFLYKSIYYVTSRTRRVYPTRRNVYPHAVFACSIEDI